MSVCRHWRTAGATFVNPPQRRTVFHRFPTVFQPFIDRLLTVCHRFSPFLPFSENGGMMNHKCFSMLMCEQISHRCRSADRMKGSWQRAQKLPMRGYAALVFPRILGAHGHLEIVARAVSDRHGRATPRVRSIENCRYKVPAALRRAAMFSATLFAELNTPVPTTATVAPLMAAAAMVPT